MILNLDNTEIAVLLLHMSISRRNVSRGLKKTYNARRLKEIMNSYDEVIKTLEETVDDEDKDRHILHFNIREIDMVEAFLKWYTVNLKDTLKKANNKNEEDHMQLNSLIGTFNQLEEMKEYAL